ncbi:MAG: hypothetical protein JWO80_133 [Bryobacterales bacterium]|nr:hypothetical protein [Bryobacterales bacterium]
MPDLKRFPVFGERGRIGTMAAAARFLDSRTEKTIQLDDGGEISVPADALTVRSDGSFYLRDAPPVPNASAPPAAEAAPAVASEEPARQAAGLTGVNGNAPIISPDAKMFREGYAIERVQVDRIVAEPPVQRQEGDTLVLPVVEEVLVVEKRLMLREEIRITRRREQVEQIQTINSSA